MIDTDYDSFVREFQRLYFALGGFRQSREDATAKIDAYFTVLKKFSIIDVIAKADRWLETESKFPKPAEWAAVVIRAKAMPLPQLSAVEAAEWLEAERLRWEGQRCECVDCRVAGLGELQRLRFVPEFTAADHDRWVMIGSRRVTAGHWAHGEELKRWYAAKVAFWQKCADLGLMDAKGIKRKERDSRPFVEQLEDIFPKTRAVRE